MNMMTLSHGEQPVSGGFRVDVSRGQRIGRVSSEWFTRPDDERFLNLSDLYQAVRGRAERAQARTVESRAIRVEASRESSERLALMVAGRDEQVMPTHWSFGQLCTLVGAPTSYLRQLPAALSAINLQHGLLSHRAELVKTLEADNGRVELRAVTGPDYGRIWDHELVAAVMKIAGNGTGDTRWKVPGVMHWSTMTHNPFVDVTKETTTLYASDRDVLLFLVDDTILSYAILAEYFPKELAGRANAALNLFHIGGAFVVQYMTGLVLQLWDPTNGHYPEIAYRTAFAFNIGLQIVAGIWFVLTLKPLQAFELRSRLPGL